MVLRTDLVQTLMKFVVVVLDCHKPRVNIHRVALPQHFFVIALFPPLQQ
jgi:hypothetical protein